MNSAQNEIFKLLKFGGESDHIHLMLDLHQTVEPAELVNNWKIISSRERTACDPKEIHHKPKD